MTQKYQVLARKYRPQKFSEVVSQQAVVTTLKNALRFSQIAHAYLFSGSRGVGKTTLARLFAKALNCQDLGSDFEPCNKCPSCVEITSGQSLDVIEIDGASNRGIDDIRQINETVGYAPSRGRYKIYIIDEVHMLTKEAFNALLKTLEEPPEKAKFFFATTEAHKVLPTIISRCQRFDLGRILPSQIISKLEEIGTDLGRTIEPEALHHIAAFSDGSLRDAESLFDQILCFVEGDITADAVRKALGLISQEHFFSLDKAFSECRPAYAFELVDYLFQNGKDLPHFLEQLIEHYRLLTVCKTMGEAAIPSPLAASYVHSSRLYTQAQCLYLLEYLLNAEQQLQKSASQRVCLEAILLHIIRSKNRIPVEVIAKRLLELEESLLTSSATPLAEEKSTTPPPRTAQHPEPKTLKPETAEKPLLPIQPVEKQEDRPSKSSMEAAPILKKEDGQTFESEWTSLLDPVPLPLDSRAVNQTKTEPPIDCPPKNIIRQSEPKEVKPSVNSVPELENTAPLPPVEKKLTSPKAVMTSEKESELKPIPFNPYNISVEVPLEKKETNFETPSSAVQSAAAKHPSHYDTLIRFAAVELEGSFKN